MTRPEIDIPSSSDHLSAEWLTRVFAQHADLSGCEVVAVERDAIEMSMAFSSVVRLVPRYAGSRAAAAPQTVIVKMHSSDEQIIALGLHGLYEIEVRFYRDVAPRLGGTVPKCWFSQVEVDSHRHAIVLEDLREFSIPSQIAGCGALEAANAVRTLAEIHARCWGVEHRDGIAWAIDGVELATDDQLARLADIWPSFERRFADLLTPDVVAVGSRLAAGIPAIAQTLCERPATLCHGDFRLSNLAFGSDPARPVVAFDWQNACRAPGALDLAYFLSQSVETLLRRRHEAEWLDLYLATLARHGVAGYARSDLEADYRLATILAFLHPIAACRYLGIEESAPGLVDTLARRGAVAVADASAAELML